MRIASWLISAISIGWTARSCCAIGHNGTAPTATPLI
jgi:hypothetical protein